MVGALGPEGMFGIKACLGVSGQHAAHIRGVWALEVVQRIAVPRDVKDAHHPSVVFLNGTYFRIRRHFAAQGVLRHPRVGEQVAKRSLIFCRCANRRTQKGQQGCKQANLTQSHRTGRVHTHEWNFSHREAEPKGYRFG